MRWTKEKREYIPEINRLLMDLFPWESVHGKIFFIAGKGWFHVSEVFGDAAALVIEYAEDEEAARNGRTEDGDLFYEDEWDLKSMYAAMLREIYGADEKNGTDLLEMFGHKVEVIDEENRRCFGEIVEYTDTEDGEPEECITVETKSGEYRGFYRSGILFVHDCGPA